MMKIAIAGKGGVGKTTITAVLSYLFARDHEVLAIDCDPSMNLAFTLGVRDFKPLSELKDVIHERVGRGLIFKLNPKVDDIVEKYSVENEDGIKLLVLGTINRGGEGCFCPESAFLRAVLRHAILKSEFLFLDMDAGIEHLGRGTAKGVDAMITVIEPNLKSVETAKKIESLAKDIGIDDVYFVVNKYFGVDFFDFDVLSKIPFDEKILEADLKGVAPYKLCDLKPFEDLMKKLLDLVSD